MDDAEAQRSRQRLAPSLCRLGEILGVAQQPPAAPDDLLAQGRQQHVTAAALHQAHAEAIL